MQATLERPPQAEKPQAAETVRLNLGGGNTEIDGYTNIDRKTGHEIFPLALPDESADEIRASHCLEHLSHAVVPQAVRDWVRVLKPGGVLKIAVPDFEKIATSYLAGESINVQGYVMGGHTDDDDHHGCIFDRESLTELLRQCGLVGVREWRSDFADCSSLPISLNLQAEKPKPTNSTTCAVMSMSRLAFTETMFSVIRGVVQVGIPVEPATTVFWGATLTRLIERRIDEYDYVLTIDHDSIFSREDVQRLITIMDANPGVDALFPVQMKRGGGQALLYIEDENGKPKSRIAATELECDAYPVTTGHFGLTLLRTSSLKRLPKPWFHAQPDANGSWGEGRTDEDIWFWRQMERAGMRACIAPHVVIGHSELVSTWPDRGWNKLYQPLHDYVEHGKPQGVWR